MTRTEFGNLSFLWGCWTFFEAVGIALLWWTRSRVLGNGVCRVHGARRVRRGACARRVDALLVELTDRGVGEGGRPDKGQLVDRWHRVVAGRCVSVLLQTVPLLIVVLPFWWATSVARTTDMPFWMFAAVIGFGVVSITLMAADERTTAVSDPAGAVTTESVRFLEMLLMPARRRHQDSALDDHGRFFGRLCDALRAQARYGMQTMRPGARERVWATTERLIWALAEADQRYLFGEGDDRDTAVRDLSRLVASAVSHSCRPRGQRDSLLIVDPALLADAPRLDGAGPAAEPLRSRLLAGAARLAVALGLFAGAFSFRGEGDAPTLLVAAGLATAALVLPPLREALRRFGGIVPGAFGGSLDGRQSEPSDGDPNLPESAAAARCPHRDDCSAATPDHGR